MPAAGRKGDKDSNGDKLVEGSSGVFIGESGGYSISGGEFVAREPYSWGNARALVSMNGTQAIYDTPEELPEKEAVPERFPKEEITEEDPVTEEVKTEEKKVEPVSPECPVVNAGNIDYSIKLSQNYTLRSLTLGTVFPHALREQRGLTASEIACNLKYLAENAIEPIMAAFPQLNITSCFRQGSGKSDHQIGSAVDMQVYSAGPDFYRKVLAFIDENIPYTQVIIETSNGGRSYWVHVACRRTQVKSAKPKLTYLNSRYIDGWRLPA